MGQIPLNKVSGPLSQSMGNTTLPLEYVSIVAIAILESGVGIRIATKSILEIHSFFNSLNNIFKLKCDFHLTDMSKIL